MASVPDARECVVVVVARSIRSSDDDRAALLLHFFVELQRNLGGSLVQGRVFRRRRAHQFTVSLAAVGANKKAIAATSDANTMCWLARTDHGTSVGQTQE